MDWITVEDFIEESAYLEMLESVRNGRVVNKKKQPQDHRILKQNEDSTKDRPSLRRRLLLEDDQQKQYAKDEDSSTTSSHATSIPARDIHAVPPKIESSKTSDLTTESDDGRDDVPNTESSGNVNLRGHHVMHSLPNHNVHHDGSLPLIPPFFHPEDIPGALRGRHGHQHPPHQAYNHHFEAEEELKAHTVPDTWGKSSFEDRMEQSNLRFRSKQQHQRLAPGSQIVEVARVNHILGPMLFVTTIGLFLVMTRHKMQRKRGHRNIFPANRDCLSRQHLSDGYLADFLLPSNRRASTRTQEEIDEWGWLRDT